MRLRDEFRTNDDFRHILTFLDEYAACSDEDEKAALAETFAGTVTQEMRVAFAMFLEDIAMAMKSGALKAVVANYSFGHYAILCWENEPFWRDLGRDDPYWVALRYLVWRMKLHRKILKAAPWLIAFSLRV